MKQFSVSVSSGLPQEELKILFLVLNIDIDRYKFQLWCVQHNV